MLTALKEVPAIETGGWEVPAIEFCCREVPALLPALGEVPAIEFCCCEAFALLLAPEGLPAAASCCREAPALFPADTEAPRALPLSDMVSECVSLRFRALGGFSFLRLVCLPSSNSLTTF